MINSIKYFEEECINKFEQLEDEFLKHPDKMAEFVLGITDELHKLGLAMIQEALETMDRMIQESPVRRRKWTIETHSQKQLTTSLGDIRFLKTLFTNKETGESEYLLDRILGLEPKERLTEDAEAKLLKEAVQTSYRRGGKECSLTSEVSKQTVKNKIHKLEFPKNTEQPVQKKVVDYLYIDADEDHISLQYREKKGDLKVSENHRKNNGLIAKLVYVYEGIEKEAPQSKRHHLVNPHYFCGVSTEDNVKFWDEIYNYMNDHYELEKVKKIYVNSDGGGWIKAGMKRLSGTVHVLDEFHLEKYLTRLTGHMKDSQEEATNELRATIRSKTKKDFEELVDELEEYLTGDQGRKRMEESKEYILSNWTAAKLRLKHKDGIVGSSTEGHVSHVLSDRMSSRPMGWSIKGAEKMTRLRAYDLNDGDMLKLVRYQKKELKKAAGAEHDILSATQIMESERNRHGMLGKYIDTITHSMPITSKKIVYFNSHIWGL
jgi:hypothetical protein